MSSAASSSGAKSVPYRWYSPVSRFSRPAASRTSAPRRLLVDSARSWPARAGYYAEKGGSDQVGRIAVDVRPAPRPPCRTARFRGKRRARRRAVARSASTRRGVRGSQCRGVSASMTQAAGPSRRNASAAPPRPRADAPRAVERPMHDRGAASRRPAGPIMRSGSSGLAETGGLIRRRCRRAGSYPSCEAKRRRQRRPQHDQNTLGGGHTDGGCR